MNTRWIAQKLAETSRPALQALAFGLLVAILLIISDELSLHFVLGKVQRIVDDIVGGVIAGLVLFAYARLRLRFLTERLNMIGLMNHHVRNALQVIRDVRQLEPRNPTLTAVVEDAVNRIDWALREVLPGRITNHDEQGWKSSSR
jgi:hypothetical protein